MQFFSFFVVLIFLICNNVLDILVSIHVCTKKSMQVVGLNIERLKDKGLVEETLVECRGNRKVAELEFVARKRVHMVAA